MMSLKTNPRFKEKIFEALWNVEMSVHSYKVVPQVVNAKLVYKYYFTRVD